MKTIEKYKTGIEGFDEITHGGLPKGRTTLLLGGTGCGKTIFALQTLLNGAKTGEHGIFVAFEESAADLQANALEFDWPKELFTEEKIAFLDARLSADVVQSGGFDLGGLLSMIAAKAEKMGATRIVFDGIDVLLSLLGDPMAERREIGRVNSWIKERGMTALMTAKTQAESDETPERYGFLPYLSDCVVLIYHRIIEHFSVRGLRVVKYRGSNHAAGEFPLVIYKNGLAVSYLAESEMKAVTSSKRVSSGLPRLDTMLSGGFLRGSSVLISGAPGTAKTTLCAAFIEEACRRNEKALFVSFDESGEEVIRNMASVGIDLASYAASGLLQFSSVRSKSMGAEEHYTRLYDIIKETQPGSLVIDSLSALNKAGGMVAALDVALRLLDYAKRLGITTLCTSLIEGEDAEVEKTAVGISTVADTWMQLAYVNREGERNRTLTIIKSRGTKHSNQVRELVLSDEGLELYDAYSGGVELLLGTARWEKERAERQEIERTRRELAEKRQEIKRRSAENLSRLRDEREELQTHLDMLKTEERKTKEKLRDEINYKIELLIRRGADVELLDVMMLKDEPSFAHDENFFIVEANASYLAAAGGISREEAIGKHYWDVFPKGSGAMKSCLDALETGKYEDELFTAENRRRYRSVHRSVSNREGEYRYSLHILEEIEDEESL